MLTAVAMGAALAHFFELPNKIDIGAADYLTVQRNYDNWWIVGLIVPLAFVSVLALTIALRGAGPPFTLAADSYTVAARRRAHRVLGLHRASQPRDRELDDAARQLGGAACAMGIFPRGESASLCAGDGHPRHVSPGLAC